MRWFTSDLHLGHANVIDYCGRPFANVGLMNAALIAAWNSYVRPDDEVWVLGDVAMGRIDESLAMAAQLTGRKHLLVGNHDRPFENGTRQAAWTERYLDEGGFASIHHGALDIELSDGTLVTACHFPYQGDSGDRDRFEPLRPVDEGRWLLHGHVHEKWRQRGRMINVGVDAWAGRPVADDDVVALIAAGPVALPRLDWTWPPSAA